jgi:hypothetical protein
LFILFTIVVSLMYLVPGDNISSEPEEPKEPEEDEEDDEGVGDFRLFLLCLVFAFFPRSLLGEQFPPTVCARRATQSFNVRVVLKIGFSGRQYCKKITIQTRVK